MYDRKPRQRDLVWIEAFKPHSSGEVYRVNYGDETVQVRMFNGSPKQTHKFAVLELDDFLGNYNNTKRVWELASEDELAVDPFNFGDVFIETTRSVPAPKYIYRNKEGKYIATFEHHVKIRAKGGVIVWRRPIGGIKNVY